MTEQARMARTFIVHVRAIVEVTINDPDAVARCFTDDWRDAMYRFDTEGEVLDHLAICVGCRDMRLSRMDGWADLPDSAVEARVLGWEGGDD